MKELELFGGVGKLVREHVGKEIESFKELNNSIFEVPPTVTDDLLIGFMVTLLTKNKIILKQEEIEFPEVSNEYQNHPRFTI